MTDAAQDFGGLVAAVTGGASGIGLATARLLRTRGARVAVLDLAPAPDADQLSVPCDVTSDGDVRGAVDRVATELGGLDVVVANAGIGATGSVEAGSDEQWARVLDVNVTGVARVVRAALPHLRASRSASVVLTSSVVALVGVPNRALYAASKGAVAALALAMAADHVGEGIRVNAVAPGTADTPWVVRLLAAASDPEAERARPGGTPAAGAPRHARGGCGGDRLPGLAAVRLDDGHRPHRGRRHDRPAPAALTAPYSPPHDSPARPPRR